MTAILQATTPPSALVEGLARTPVRLAALVEGVTEAALDAAPAGEWTARTVLAHIRDDEFLVMRVRLARMLAEEHPTLTPFDEGAWAATRWLDRDTPAELLGDIELQREASVAILQRLPAEAWHRPGTQPEIGTFTLQWWVEHWLEHDVNHLEQIATLLGRPVPE
ncbi:MAG: hypothetical protein AMXMBFR23_09460 [Chloroflexota bacterium]